MENFVLMGGFSCSGARPSVRSSTKSQSPSNALKSSVFDVWAAPRVERVAKAAKKMTAADVANLAAYYAKLPK